MKRKKIKILEFSDIHLGHPNTPTTHIIENLYSCFKSGVEFSEYDIVFIAGDVFDRLMNLADPNGDAIKMWMNYFLRLCKKYDTSLRVLEGTPSHDWKQSRHFQNINEMARIGCDLKYVETLSIEHIEKFGINVLYVPDEWLPECDDTWKEVQQLLLESNLKKVDFSIMHGAFDYQLPSHVPSPTHVPERYLGITKYLVFIGHVHKHSLNDRIVSAGSFDRLTHGEEEPKGYIEATVCSDGTFEIKFIENEGAKVYKTINCSTLTLEEALKLIDKEVYDLKPTSSVRIKAQKEDPILTNLDVLRKKHPTLQFTNKVEKEKRNVSDSVIAMSQDAYQPINITPSNIKGLLSERMKETNLDNCIIERSLLLLEDHM